MPVTETAPAVTQTQLAAIQAQFVRALMNAEPAPEGFETERFAATTRGLFLKRKRAVQMTWPMLQVLLGENFDHEFLNFAKGAALPSIGGPAADGRHFVEFLSQRMHFPDGLTLAALHYDLNYSKSADGFDTRRGFVLRLAALREERRYALGFRIPGLGERIIRLPSILPRRHHV